MKVTNKSARLLCFQTSKGRVEVLPGVVTDDERLDALKGKDKIFDHYLKEEIIREVKNEATKSGGEKELLKTELKALGVAAGNMGVEKLKLAITEALEDKADELDVEYEGLDLDELRTAVAEAEADL